MRNPIFPALVIAWLAGPAPADAAADPCATARRLAMLESAFRLLLLGPATPEAAETAFYAEVLALSLAEDAPPGTAETLAELGRFAALIRATEGRAALAPDARARHLAQVARLETARRASACPDPDIPGGSAESGDEAQAGSGLADRPGSGKAGERARFAVADFGLHEADWMQDASAVFSLRGALAALGVVALCGLVWLVRALAMTWLASLLRARPEGPARQAWYLTLLARIARDRRKARHHVLGRFFDVTAQGEGVARRIKVADISKTGAKLAWTGAPQKGARLAINLDGIRRTAQIVWLNPHFCGVSFDDALTDAELLMVLARPADLPAGTGELEMF